MTSFSVNLMVLAVIHGSTIMSITSTALPRWGRVPDAVKHSGVKRGKLYQLAAKHRGLFRKFDDVTLVDLHMLDDIIADFPPADLKDEPAA